jgi:hypothetical protein
VSDPLRARLACLPRYDTHLVVTDRDQVRVRFESSREGPWVPWREIEALLARSEANDVERLLRAALLALRSYQYGNAATDLAREVADPIDAYLTAAVPEPKE